MGKNSWIALLLALVVLVSTVPACAVAAESPGVETYSEDDYGGLAPDPVRPPREPGRPAGEGDNGGIAPDQPTVSKIGRASCRERVYREV